MNFYVYTLSPILIPRIFSIIPFDHSKVQNSNKNKSEFAQQQIQNKQKLQSLSVTQEVGVSSTWELTAQKSCQSHQMQSNTYTNHTAGWPSKSREVVITSCVHTILMYYAWICWTARVHTIHAQNFRLQSDHLFKANGSPLLVHIRDFNKKKKKRREEELYRFQTSEKSLLFSIGRLRGIIGRKKARQITIASA